MPRDQLIQVRRDTAANWTSRNPTLSAGELGLETDTGKIKGGDGSTAWTSLAYSGAAMTAAQVLAALLTVDGSGSGLDADLLDGSSSAAFVQVANNLSDVTAATARTNLGLGSLATASTVTTSEITDGTVANGDLANMAAKTVKMRHTNSTGAPEDTTMANLLADASGQNGAAFSFGDYEIDAKDFAPRSATGATAAARYFRGTTSGPPTTGTWAVGDVSPAQDGRIFVCISAGTPGTWQEASFSSVLYAPVSGTVISPSCILRNSGAFYNAWTQNRLYYSPVALGVGTLDRVYQTINATGAGETYRLGLYTDNGGKPSALVADWGTINVSTGGQKSITISQSITKSGLYWLGQVHQGGATASVLHHNVCVATWPGASVVSATPYTTNPGWYDSATVSGALPSNVATLTATTDVPIVAVRYA